MAFVQEALGCTKSKAVGITAGAAVVGSLFCLWFTKDTTGWGAIDDWVGTFLIVVLAFFQIVAFGWRFGTERGLREAHEGAQLRIPRFMGFIIKFVAPAYLLVAIVMACKNDLPAWIAKATAPETRQAGYALLLIAALTVGLVILTRIGEKRWRAAGLDVDGIHPPDDEKQSGGAR
jgi:hypothetical protein